MAKHARYRWRNMRTSADGTPSVPGQVPLLKSPLPSPPADFTPVVRRVAGHEVTQVGPSHFSGQDGLSHLPKEPGGRHSGVSLAFGDRRIELAELKEIVEFSERIVGWFEPAFEPAAK
jgi:hypothetical protein